MLAGVVLCSSEFNSDTIWGAAWLFIFRLTINDFSFAVPGSKGSLDFALDHEGRDGRSLEASGFDAGCAAALDDDGRDGCFFDGGPARPVLLFPVGSSLKIPF